MFLPCPASFLLLMGKLPQTEWLKTTWSYYTTVFSVRSPAQVSAAKSGISEAAFLSGSSRGPSGSLPSPPPTSRVCSFTHGPFLRLQSQKWQMETSSDVSSTVTSFCDHSQVRFSAFRQSCDYTGPPDSSAPLVVCSFSQGQHWDLGNNIIPISHPDLLGNVTSHIHNFLGLGHEHSPAIHTYVTRLPVHPSSHPVQFFSWKLFLHCFVLNRTYHGQWSSLWVWRRSFYLQ